MQYSTIFNEHIHAGHIIFVYSLLRSIEEYKLSLRQKDLEKRILENEKTVLNFLRNRGATFLLHAAIASCIELIVNRPVPNKFALSFGQNTPPQTAVENWTPIVRIMVPFSSSLEPAVHDSIQSKEDVRKAIEIFRLYCWPNNRSPINVKRLCVKVYFPNNITT